MVFVLPLGTLHSRPSRQYTGQRLESFSEGRIRPENSHELTARNLHFQPTANILLRDVVDVLMPFIWTMCNASFHEGHTCQIHRKLFSRRPRTQMSFKNRRPISNLNFILKVIERTIAVQLQSTSKMPTSWLHYNTNIAYTSQQRRRIEGIV